MTLVTAKRRPFYARRSVSKRFKPVVRGSDQTKRIRKLQRMMKEAEEAHDELRKTLAEFGNLKMDNPEAEKLLKKILSE